MSRHRVYTLFALTAVITVVALPAASAWSVADLQAVAAQRAKDAQVLINQIKSSAQPTIEATILKVKKALQGSTPAQHSADHGAAVAREAFESITGGHEDRPAGADASDGGANAEAIEPETMDGSAGAGGGPGVPLIRTLSFAPRSMLWEGFLTMAECDHLVKLGAKHITPSDVVDSETGEIVRSKERTSSGAFLPNRHLDPIVTALEERIARWVQIPVNYGEPFHILRYLPSEEYTAHFDSFFDNVHIQNGGQRIATVILYLSNVEEGGETVFPDSKTKPSEAEAAGFSECAKKGLGVKPRKGDALLFFSLKPDGTTKDMASLHAGCPVIKGTKWIATKWIRVGHYWDWADPEETAEATKSGESAAAASEPVESTQGEAEANEAKDEL